MRSYSVVSISDVVLLPDGIVPRQFFNVVLVSGMVAQGRRLWYVHRHTALTIWRCGKVVAVEGVPLEGSMPLGGEGLLHNSPV